MLRGFYLFLKDENATVCVFSCLQPGQTLCHTCHRWKASHPCEFWCGESSLNFSDTSSDSVGTGKALDLCVYSYEHLALVLL